MKQPIPIEVKRRAVLSMERGEHSFNIAMELTRQGFPCSDATVRGWKRQVAVMNVASDPPVVSKMETVDEVITQEDYNPYNIGVIGDTQVKPNIELGYCNRIGRYMAKERPKAIVMIGDFADMPSLSFHDVAGSKNYEGQRYREDILSVHQGMKALMEPILEEMKFGWKPRLVMTLGNHEHRINRTIEATPKLDGVIGLPDLEYERWGWEVHPFLKQVVIKEVAFSHYFCSGQMGRPIASAVSMLNKLHMSCVAGHQQGRDIRFGKRADGKQITAIICGSSYEHDENYLNHQTNNHWRGFYMLNDVVDGEFEEKAVSMKYLRRLYGDY